MALGTLTFSATTVNRITSAQPSYVDLLVQCDEATNFTIYRKDTIGTGTIIVRGADNVLPSAPDTLHAFDYEAPPGVTLHYIAEATDGTTTLTATDDASPVDHGGDWLMPIARPELGMIITVEKGGAGELERPLLFSQSHVINRPDPVVVSWGRKLWKANWSFLTLNKDERLAFLQLIQYPHILFIPRYDYGFEEPIFCVFGETNEQRVTGFGYEAARRWKVEVIQIARPPATYIAPPARFTWASRLAEAETWDEVRATFVDWFDYSGYGDLPEEVGETLMTSVLS